MSTFFGALGSFSRTFGTTMNSSVQKALFYSRAKKYASNLEAALDGPNIPVSVYMRLIEGVNAHLPTFHRYLKLRRRVMNLPDELHYYDLYAPLVSSVELRYTPEEAQGHVVTAMQPLGADYTGVLERGFRDRWVDWYPTEGKVSGAYSNGGAYDVHPYILLNYLGQYNDVSTLAHELGHTMHSYYSNKTQPYRRPNYTTFVAEVASTFNEALLIDHMLKHDRRHADAAVAARQLSRGHQVHGVPPDAVRRVRAADARDGGEGAADHRRGAVRAVSRHLPPLLRPRRRRVRRGRLSSSTSGASSRTSTASSTCSSTPRRSAPPRRCRPRCSAGDTAARATATWRSSGGRVAVPDRPAARRRRGHDDRRAARRSRWRA